MEDVDNEDDGLDTAELDVEPRLPLDREVCESPPVQLFHPLSDSYVESGYTVFKLVEVVDSQGHV